MNTLNAITKLHEHREVFEALLLNAAVNAHWRPEPSKWCLLEVICHLYDEERDDFRARVEHTLHHPGVPAPLFDQLAWIDEHKYMQQDFSTKLKGFLDERTRSVQWLRSLDDPNWDNGYQHHKLGYVSAGYFLANWVAHDLLHMRQIIRLKFEFWQQSAGVSSAYAGSW